MAVSAQMTATSPATQTMNIRYVQEHIHTTPHHPCPFAVELGLLLTKLGLPTGHGTNAFMGMAEKQWKMLF